MSRSDADPLKPSSPIFTTEEGISIRQSDLQSQKPQISFKRLLDEKISSLSDVHLEKPEDPIFSTEEGISIRESDVQF
jgi:hypothetical protein